MTQWSDFKRRSWTVSLSSCFCLGQGRPTYLNLVGTGSLERWCQLVFLDPPSVVTTGHLGVALVMVGPSTEPLLCAALCAAPAVGSRGFLFFGFSLLLLFGWF